MKRILSGVLAAVVLLAGGAAHASSQEKKELDRERRAMVTDQILRRGVEEPTVLSAMWEVPRHLFVPLDLQRMAYMDGPLPIGEGQTIPQPYLVARMAELAEIGPGDKVLEIGTGSGYEAAVLSQLGKEVFTVEPLPNLAAQAEKRLQAMGYTQVHVRTGDGAAGWPEKAPFDAILVSAAAGQVPPPLLDQLAEGGVLVTLSDSQGGLQRMVRLRKKEGTVERETVTAVGK